MILERTTVKYIITLLITILFWIFFAFTPENNIIILIILHSIITISAVSFVKGDLAHPITIFSFIFYLYFVAYPVCVFSGLLPDNNNTGEVLVLHTIGYIAFIFPSLFSRVVRPIRFKSIISNKTFLSAKALNYILIFFGLLDLLYSLYHGYGKPSKFTESEGFQLGVSYSFTIAASTLVLIYNIYKNNKYPVNYILGVFIYLLLTFLITGERSYIVKFILSTLLISEHFFRFIPIKRFIPLFLIGFLFFGISKNFAMILNFKRINPVISDRPKIEKIDKIVKIGLPQFFYGEFKTSGRITSEAILVYRNKHLYGESILQDLERFLLPPALRGTDEKDFLTYKLTNRLAYGTKTGLGSSVIAKAYVNFEYIGVFSMMYAVGFLISKLFYMASFSPVYLALYALTYSQFCINLRHGVVSFLGSSFKTVCIPLLICFILQKLFVYKYQSFKGVNE